MKSDPIAQSDSGSVNPETLTLIYRFHDSFDLKNKNQAYLEKRQTKDISESPKSTSILVSQIQAMMKFSTVTGYTGSLPYNAIERRIFTQVVETLFKGEFLLIAIPRANAPQRDTKGYLYFATAEEQKLALLSHVREAFQEERAVLVIVENAKKLEEYREFLSKHEEEAGYLMNFFDFEPFFIFFPLSLRCYCLYTNVVTMYLSHVVTPFIYIIGVLHFRKQISISGFRNKF